MSTGTRTETSSIGAAAEGRLPWFGTSLRELYATMALIRAFETRVAELYRDGEIPGFVHTSLGQEAVAAGVGAALARRRLPRDDPPRPRPRASPRAPTSTG